MSEVWQFLAVGAVAVVVILLWIFIIYLPRRTGEDLSRHSATDIREDSVEDEEPR